MAELKHPQRVLWIALFKGIGDAVLLYPAVKRCSEFFPDASVDLLFRNEAGADVFGAYGFKGRILVMPKRREALLGYLIRLGLRSYDVVLDASSIQQMHLSRWLTLLLSHGQRVGYHYGSSSWLYSHRLDTSPLNTLHMKDIYVNLLSSFGPVSPACLEAPPPDPALLQRLSLPTSRVRVVVHPGGRDSLQTFEKRWPISRYGQLIGMLKKEREAHVILIGARREKQWIDQNLSSVIDPRSVNMAGATDVGQLFEVIRSADLFIGNNSGPLHMAAACGTPLVTFAGGIPLQRWGVTDMEQNVVLGIDKRCPECTEYECDRHGEPCLSAVTVEEAHAAACKLLDMRAAR